MAERRLAWHLVGRAHNLVIILLLHLHHRGSRVAFTSCACLLGHLGAILAVSMGLCSWKYDILFHNFTLIIIIHFNKHIYQYIQTQFTKAPLSTPQLIPPKLLLTPNFTSK